MTEVRSARIGTPMVPELEEFRDKVVQLRFTVAEALEQTGVNRTYIEAHNLYTAFSVMLLLHGSGHRPVQDPFCDADLVGPHWGLVEDKVVSERHRNRFVALPPSAIEQIRNYHRHLNILRDFLSADGALSGDLITGMIRSSKANCRILPQFFFLQEDGQGTVGVSEREICGWIGDWPWPLNAGRHLLAQGLHQRNVASRYIRLQLGQLGWGEGFFGSDEVLSPDEFVGAVAKPLEEILTEDQGWQTLPSWQIQPRASEETPPVCPLPSITHRPWPLGPTKRAQQRQERERAATKAVAPWKERIQEEGGSGDTLHAAVANIEAEFENYPDLANKARNALLTWVWHDFPQKARSSRIPRQVTVPQPVSPFRRTWPRQLQQAQEYQQAFLEYLRQRGEQGTEPSVAERLAEIILSAALWGGLAASGSLRELPRALSRSTWRISPAKPGGTRLQEIWVEGEGQQDNPALPEWRWVPDSLSATLIVQYWEGFDGDQREKALRPVKATLRKILKELESLPRGPVGEASGQQDPYPVLANLAASLALYQQTPLCRPFAQGSKRPTPLPATSWFRLIRGQALANEQASPTEPNPEGQTATVVLPQASPGRSSEAGPQFHRSLVALFRDLRDKRDKGEISRETELKRALQKEVQNLLGAGHAYPPSAVVVGEWTLNLLKNGTRYHSNLAFSTIQRYVLQIARPLLYSAGDLDLGRMDPEGLEELYQEMLTYPRRPREEVALGRRIREFHSFLENYHGYDPLDWSFLPEGDSNQAADAQVITVDEYHRALDDLRQDPSVDEGGQLLQAGALVLGFRFGLRSGEVFRCRACDLFLARSRQAAQVTVQPNLYGRTKSRAATRVVPSIEALSEHELRLLENLRDRAVHLVPKQPERQALLLDGENPGVAWARDEWVLKVQKALRVASGEKSLRFHHLRHSFASRLLLRLGADHWDSVLLARIRQNLSGASDNSAELRRWIAGQSHWSQRVLDGWAKVLGHKNPATTASHYFHFPEIVSKQNMEHRLPGELPESVWVYCRGVTRKSLDVMARRKGGLPWPPVPQDWPQAVPNLPMSPRRGGSWTAFPRRESGEPNVTLLAVFDVLVSLRERELPDQRLVEMTGLPLEIVRAVQDHADQVASNANWAELAPNVQIQNARKARFPGRDRVRARLVEWQELGEERLDELGTRAEIWERVQARGRGVAVLQGFREAHDFLTLMGELGVLSELEVLLTLEVACQPGDEVLALLEEKGLEQKRAAWLSKEVANPRSGVQDGAIGIGVRPKGRWGTRGNMAAAIFVLRVYGRHREKNFWAKGTTYH